MDWESICSNPNAASTSEITMKNVMDAWKKFYEIPKATIDIFVTTYKIMDKIKTKLEVRDVWEPYRIMGLPVYLYHSNTIARLEAEDLAKQGKHVCLITEDDFGQIHHRELIPNKSPGYCSWSKLQGGFWGGYSWSNPAIIPRSILGIYS